MSEAEVKKKSAGNDAVQIISQNSFFQLILPPLLSTGVCNPFKHFAHISHTIYVTYKLKKEKKNERNLHLTVLLSSSLHYIISHPLSKTLTHTHTHSRSNFIDGMMTTTTKYRHKMKKFYNFDEREVR